MSVGEASWETRQKWRRCVAALEQLFFETRDESLSEPSPQAVFGALRLLREADQAEFPPPSIVVKEPSGGLILEFDDGALRAILTVYNDLSFEFDLLHEGQIIADKYGRLLESDSTFYGTTHRTVDSATTWVEE